MPKKRRPWATWLAAIALVAGVFACSRPRSGTADAGTADAGTADAGAAGAEQADSGAEGLGAAPVALAPSASAVAASPAPKGRPEPPAGYVTVTVLDVVPTSQGAAVLLADPGKDKIVPIFVGGTEALSIELRLAGKRYPRPLTHDLLDSMVAKLGGDLVKVHVDDVRNQVYIGSVFVRQSGKVLTIDARPSDAIALALGRGAPIFVAAKVIAQGGILRRDLVPEGDDPERVRVPPSGPDPMAL